ncbi:hypothetical protein [Flindersiella endophytica]
MTGIYTYELATLVDGHWQTTIHAEREFTRDPRSIARGLLEQWIIGRAQHLPGGGRVVVCGRRRPDRQCANASVRVRVYPGRLDGHTPGPAATAYLTRGAQESGHRRAA